MIGVLDIDLDFIFECENEREAEATLEAIHIMGHEGRILNAA